MVKDFPVTELRWERQTEGSGSVRDLLILTLRRPEGDRLLTIPVERGKVSLSTSAPGEGKDE